MKNKLDLLYSNQLKELGDLSDTSIQIITVGEDVASQIYVKNKIKLLSTLNCNVKHTVLPENTSQEELENIINLRGRNFTAQFVQLPLPKHLEEPEIPAHQDVDGFNPSNKKVIPCTVQACLDIMDYSVGNISGLKIAILGRSNIVGLPLVVECIKKSATVTSFNSQSEMPNDWSEYDIVVSATGNRFLTNKDLKNTKLVIDVGIHRIDGKICGDIIHLENEESNHITPVPFGVGRFTVLNVARNLRKLK